MFSLNRIFKLLLTALLTLSLLSTPMLALASKHNDFNKHPFYVGAQIGYATTTWKHLVSEDMSLWGTTPLHVKEGDLSWGIFIGYEFEPQFALEAEYLRLPTATLAFDKQMSIYIYRDHIQRLRTKTDVMTVHGKFMAPLASLPIRIFAIAGIAIIHRTDFLADTKSNVGADFGAGFNFNVSPHVLAEFGFEFFTGQGVTEYEPIRNFIPFLYTLHFKLAYRFSI